MRILNFPTPATEGQTLGPDYLGGYWVTTPTGLRGARPEEIVAHQQELTDQWEKRAKFRAALGLPV